MIYEKITKKELESMNREDGITPNYTYERFMVEDGVEYYINLAMHKTADEVYRESLLPVEPPVDKTEILEQEVSRLEIEMLKMKKGMV